MPGWDDGDGVTTTHPMAVVVVRVLLRAALCWVSPCTEGRAHRGGNVSSVSSLPHNHN